MKKNIIICRPFIFLFTVFLFGILESCNAPYVKGDVNEPILSDQNLHQYFDLEAEQGFSGVIAIMRPHHDILYKCIGFSDKEQQIQNDLNTIFDIGSLTKQFTGAAILKLEMQGKLSVKDSLFRYFPDIPTDKSNITIHQLLTHSSGFPKRIGSDLENIRKEDFIMRVFNTPLVSAPGTLYEYSHLGYSFLGVLIESVSGMTYEEFLFKNFFKPLGMNSTGYVLPNWDLSKVANGYRKCKNWGKPMDLSWGPSGPFWNLKANAGLLSTASDLMTWHTALKGDKILSDSAKEKFLFKHIKEGNKSHSYYSYGWMVTTSLRGTMAYAHEGGNGKFFSDWINYPHEQVSILVLTNEYRPGKRRGRAGNLEVASEIARILFYPHHELTIQMKTYDCFDNLPDSRIGKIAAEFITCISSGNEDDINNIIDNYFGSYLMNKYSRSYIVDQLKGSQRDAGLARINQVAITDRSFMEIELLRISDQVKIDVYLSFDKEDAYKIRGFRYNSPDS